MLLEQRADYIGEDGLHEWQCAAWLEASPASLERVERVVYTLDRSFPEPVREVKNRASAFRLEFRCWLAFTLYATVHYTDGAQEALTRDVQLTAPTGIAEPAVGARVVEDRDELDGARFEPSPLLTSEADVVLDGGGVRAIAFAGALEAAEARGVARWVHVGGSSAGAIVATLLAAGYRPSEISELLLTTGYSKDFRSRGRLGAIVWNGGMYGTRPLKEWLEDRLADSPLGKRNPTFADFSARSDAAADSTRSRRRLRIIVSDLTAARMVVFPDQIDQYQDEKGTPLVGDEYPVVDAVLMSMRVPYWFKQGVLHKNGIPHYMLDGGLLSNFPIWLFDEPHPARPTWGMRMTARTKDEDVVSDPPRTGLKLGIAIIRAVLNAARELEPSRNEARTLTIPVPADIVGPKFTDSEHEALRRAGFEAGSAFFASRGAYLNSLGQGLPEDALVAP